MDLFDNEPSQLYNLHVLFQAKAVERQKYQIDRDVVTAVMLMKYTAPFSSCIRDVGMDKFFVHYWSATQLRVYKEYCKLTEHPKVCIDATGSLVQKIRRTENDLSGHLFLYEGVIHFQSAQISVVQMLSEKHNSNAIHFWLAEWLQSGAPCPKEVVCDSSTALLNAIIRSFTKFHNVQDYVECSFLNLL